MGRTELSAFHHMENTMDTCSNPFIETRTRRNLTDLMRGCNCSEAEIAAALQGRNDAIDGEYFNEFEFDSPEYDAYEYGYRW